MLFSSRCDGWGDGWGWGVRELFQKPMGGEGQRATLSPNETLDQA